MREKSIELDVEKSQGQRQAIESSDIFSLMTRGMAGLLREIPEVGEGGLQTI